MPQQLMIPDDRQLEELRSIAQQFGTPTYVYDLRTIQRRVAEIRRAFQGMDSRLLYAMKANSQPALLQGMKDLGLGVDVVSPGELYLAMHLGFDRDRILFSANNMTNEEMHAAHSAGVLVNIGELTRLEKFGRSFPGSRVSLRINPQHGAGHHQHVVTAGERSKFGIPIDDLTAAREIARRHQVNIVALHQHIGSGNLDLEPYAKAVRVLFDVALAFPEVALLNIGGGIGVAYRPEERGFDLTGLASILEKELRRFSDRGGPAVHVWLEPGRFLTAQAGTLLVTVNTIKRSFGQVFAGTDSGMSHLIRPAIYGAYHGVVNVSRPDGAEQLYNIVGNICESSDFFAHDRMVAEIREGDVLAVLDAGAYGMSMASEYNLRPLPREVLIDAEGRSTLVRDSETPEALVTRLLGGRTA